MSVYALGDAIAEAQAGQRAVRELFPTLRRTIHDHPLVYLDSAATAQKPGAVIEAEASFYRRHNGSVHRGLHTLSAEATDVYEGSRARVAALVNAPAPDAVVFTRNATAALNLVAFGLRNRLHAGDEVLLTEMEHHANLVPWIQLARERGIVLRHLPVRDDGTLDLDRLPELLGRRTKVVSLTHVSNVVGTINPIAAIAEAAHRVGALVVVDAAQSVAHMPVDFAALGADLLVFSAHKAYGPTGLGFLVGRRSALERLEPVEYGGDMILEVRLDRVTLESIPQRFEAGTANVAAAAAFPAAIDLLDDLGAHWIRRHEVTLVGQAIERLSALDDLRLLGPLDPEARGGLVSFHDPRVHPHDMATLLDQRGVAVRAGHHCAQPLHRRLGLVASTRASFGVYNEPADVDALVDAIQFARSYFA